MVLISTGNSEHVQNMCELKQAFLKLNYDFCRFKQIFYSTLHVRNYFKVTM